MQPALGDHWHIYQDCTIDALTKKNQNDQRPHHNIRNWDLETAWYTGWYNLWSGLKVYIKILEVFIRHTQYMTIDVDRSLSANRQSNQVHKSDNWNTNLLICKSTANWQGRVTALREVHIQQQYYIWIPNDAIL
jgi:hypothetical protein